MTHAFNSVIAEMENSKTAKARLRITGEMCALLPEANCEITTADTAIAIGTVQLTSDQILECPKKAVSELSTIISNDVPAALF